MIDARRRHQIEIGAGGTTFGQTFGIRRFARRTASAVIDCLTRFHQRFVARPIDENAFSRADVRQSRDDRALHLVAMRCRLIGTKIPNAGVEEKRKIDEERRAGREQRMFQQIRAFHTRLLFVLDREKLPIRLFKTNFYRRKIETRVRLPVRNRARRRRGEIRVGESDQIRFDDVVRREKILNDRMTSGRNRRREFNKRLSSRN